MCLSAGAGIRFLASRENWVKHETCYSCFVVYLVAQLTGGSTEVRPTRIPYGCLLLGHIGDGGVWWVCGSLWRVQYLS